jgi:hypothetical protein
VKQVDVEQLLQWAYRDELIKRVTSSAEGVWARVAEVGRYGTDIDVMRGAPQRYDLGEPHRDAVVIEQAVASLPDASIDWEREAEPILGPLLALIDPSTRAQECAEHIPADEGQRSSIASWPTRAGPRRSARLEPPRRVIMVRSLRASALVTMHAKMGTRPDWKSEHPHPLPVAAERGPGPKIFGECRRKNWYSEGSYCPLRWWPSPLSIAEARADYVVWWRALVQLTAQLRLTAHAPLSPAAPQMPWRNILDQWANH